VRDDVVVVLHYTSCADTMRCVRSLVEGAPRTTILVVDNGSQDQIRHMIEARWPERIHHVRLETNTGFTGGMNAGISWALARGCRTITVLNNDTVVPAGALDVLCDTAAAERALVSPEIRYLDAPDTVWFGGAVLDRDLALARHLTPAELTRSFGDQPLRRVELLSACCVTGDSSVWAELKGFDPFYFLMFEDSDLSMRAKKRGVELLVLSRVTILHAVSASFVGPMHELGIYYYCRNGLQFLRTAVDRSGMLRLRFVRRHVLPKLGRPDPRHLPTWLRRMALVSTGLVDATRRKGGKAPTWVESLAKRV
jgi:GT2 family glycosyltransferase